MTISTGSIITAADLNNTFGSQSDIDAVSGINGRDNKFAKRWPFLARFIDVAVTSYETTPSVATCIFTPRADTRVMGMLVRAVDASATVTVSAQLTTYASDATNQYLLGRTYEVSVTSGTPTAVTASTTLAVKTDLLPDTTNGNQNELVLFGGVQYMIQAKTASGTIDVVDVVLTLESRGLRKALR